MLPALRALRVLSSDRRGSSWPVLVETDQGVRLVKLRGAAQGTGPLVAEVIVAHLAEALGLRVPARCGVTIDSPLHPPDGDYELAHLLSQSQGLNLGFRYLEPARMVSPSDLARVSPETAAAIVWLDALVLNPDRTTANPNLLWAERDFWLIDHGAALGFQYHWGTVTEATPARPAPTLGQHVLRHRVGDLRASDARLASALSREVLESAVAEVPDSFLSPMLPASSSAEALRRRRAAYVAFLWKRLKPPRTFGWS